MAESPSTAASILDVRTTAKKGYLRRLLWLKIGMLGVFSVVVFRLVQIQMLRAREYQAEARRQSEVTEHLPGTRGDIYDRNGRTIVTNILGVSFGADPTMVGDVADEIASRFARVFGKPRGYYLERLASRHRHFVWLERCVRPQFSQMLHVADQEALVEIQEPLRIYPYERLCGQVIGLTDIDNKGLSGIELVLDPYLRGKDGSVILARDAKGRKRLSADYPRVDPTVGCSATLTVDIEYQAVAEEELEKGIRRTDAESGLVIMLDPATGEILAMANSPSMHPGNPADIDPAIMRNRAVTDLFEPGSVFKVVTAAAALDRGLVRPDQKFYAENGSYRIRLANGSFRPPINDTHPYGMITFQQAIEFSSNIVMAKISDRVGAELLFTTARNFGFGIETGIELPGEISGDLKPPSEWSGTTLNSMAYGYEVGVTPIQLAAAYAAVANGGILMKPFIVKKVVDANGETVVETKPQIVRRVISAATAKTLTAMFEGVVLRGTGRSAALPGLTIAGKTGTSRKYVDGKYQEGDYTASFVGYFPAESPKVVCLVMLENPRRTGYTGGQASAPIFRDMVSKIYAISNRFSQKGGQSMIAGDGRVLPDVVSLETDVARELLEERGFKVEISGDGPMVRTELPRAGTIAKHGSLVRLMTNPQRATAPGTVLVPDLRGLAIRRAINTLEIQRLEVLVHGSGVVLKQSPEAGRQVDIGTTVTIQCEPRSRSLLSLNE
jgi:cell division protein FtsI/penicillin-binding protein 2